MIDFEDALRRDLHERAAAHRPAPGLRERVEARIAVHDRRRRARRLAASGATAALVLIAGVVAVDLGGPATTTVASLTPRSGESGWEPMAEAPIEARFQHTAVDMGGEVLVFGGYVADGRRADGAAVYDPVQGTWREVDAPPGDMGGATAAWADGQVLALDVDGGLARFDPGSGSWSERAGSPFDSTSMAVTATVWTGDRLLVVNNAGASPGAAGYDPVADAWEPFDPPPVGLVFFDAVWSGRTLLVVGDTGAGGSSFPRLVVQELILVR